VSVAKEIFRLFERRGADAYFGEPVSITEHALQAAYFGARESAPPPLMLAALLHDIGHLIMDVPDDIAEWTSDAHHEESGSRWLAERFAAAVSEPVRLHVAAKRYLCATDAGYAAKLSPASIHTLKLQGGPMDAREVAAFEAQRFFREALCLRRWDDLGKVAGLRTPGLAAHRALIETLAASAPPRG